MDKNRRVASSRQIAASRSVMGKDRATGIAMGIGITGIVAWLFYDSVWALFLGGFFVPVVCRYYEKYQRKNRQWKVLVDIRDLMLFLSSYMQAGLSIENAFLDAEMEMKRFVEKEGVVQPALHRMNERIKMNVSVEQAFNELAQQVQLEEAKEFSDILFYAKRLGGNYIKNVYRASVKLQDKIDVNQEIETVIAEKKLELKMMIVIPLVILAYIKTTSYDFIAEMYHTTVGVCMMTGCLCMYVGMALLGNRIIQIRV